MSSFSADKHMSEPLYEMCCSLAKPAISHQLRSAEVALQAHYSAAFCSDASRPLCSTRWIKLLLLKAETALIHGLVEQSREVGSPVLNGVCFIGWTGGLHYNDYNHFSCICSIKWGHNSDETEMWRENKSGKKWGCRRWVMKSNGVKSRQSEF